MVRGPCLLEISPCRPKIGSVLRQRRVNRRNQPPPAVAVQVLSQRLVSRLISTRGDLDEPASPDLGISCFAEPEKRIELGEPTQASPAVADGVLYLRTLRHLLAVGGARGED